MAGVNGVFERIRVWMPWRRGESVVVQLDGTKAHVATTT
jgi:hypothetical protein